MLYRVIDPDHKDRNGPMAVAFEDPGKSYEELSFFVARAATPAQALAALSLYSRARKVCNRTRGQPAPTPEEMYEKGYVLGRLPAKLILEAIEGTRSGKWPLSIVRDNGHDFDEKGHMNLLHGKHHSPLFSRVCILLTKEETFG